MKTDAQLKDDVNAELAWDPAIDATEIGVEVKAGIVTLSGHVSSFAEKLNAESATQRVAGVLALAVEMDVVLPSSSRRNDADIALAAKDVLKWLTVLKPGSVKVMSEKGWITLTGEVEWKYQQVAAVVAVRYLKGVMGVFDQIRIEPKAATTSIKLNIESALKRSALDNADKITVDVDGADVTLSGVIDNWGERSIVKHSAWATPGVRRVVDKMTLAF